MSELSEELLFLFFSVLRFEFLLGCAANTNAPFCWGELLPDFLFAFSRISLSAGCPSSLPSEPIPKRNVYSNLVRQPVIWWRVWSGPRSSSDLVQGKLVPKVERFRSRFGRPCLSWDVCYMAFVKSQGRNNTAYSIMTEGIILNAWKTGCPVCSKPDLPTRSNIEGLQRQSKALPGWCVWICKRALSSWTWNLTMCMWHREQLNHFCKKCKSVHLHEQVT